MATLFIYLIKVNAALILFCLGYYLVLRPLTFYTLNRVYLVGAILFSTLYPVINFSNFITRHQQIARPVQMIAVNWQQPVTASITRATIHTATTYNWPEIIFWSGVILFAIRFVFQLISLYRLHKRSEPMLLHQHLIRSVNKNINPFSFLKSIYINPKNHSVDELKAILEHEQVHVNEWHTFDILVGELSIIFYWFNPGIWLIKRAIHENIEFITDRRILQNGLDAKAYQYSLLTVTFNNSSNTLINHFNASAVKKRIIMMNAERSSPIKLSRYVFLIPVVAVLLLAFTVSKNELKKQVLKGESAMINAIKTVADKIEDSLPATTTPESIRPVTLLDAVSAGELNEQPVKKEPEILPITIKTPATNNDTVKNERRRESAVDLIAPMPNRYARVYLDSVHYPDSLYVDGRYGQTKEIINSLKDGDIVWSQANYTEDNKNDFKSNIIHIYTKNNKDFQSILDMDWLTRNTGLPKLHIMLNEKKVTKPELEKVMQDDVTIVQRTLKPNAVWVTTKGNEIVQHKIAPIAN